MHACTQTLKFLLQHFWVKSIYKVKLYTSGSLVKLLANLIFKRVLVTLQKRKSPSTMGRTHLKIAPNSSKHMCTNFSCYNHIHVSNNQLHKRPLWKKSIHTFFVNTIFWFDVFPDLFIFDCVMPKLKQETPPQVNLWESSFYLKLTKRSMESEHCQTLYPTCRTVCQCNSKEASKKTMKTYMFPQK